jgi:hypothetical protein
VRLKILGITPIPTVHSQRVKSVGYSVETDAEKFSIAQT